MTLDQFKAWLEGFADGRENAETEPIFDRIREKLEEVDESISVPISIPTLFHPIDFEPWLPPVQTPVVPYYNDPHTRWTATGTTVPVPTLDDRVMGPGYEHSSAQFLCGSTVVPADKWCEHFSEDPLPSWADPKGPRTAGEVRERHEAVYRYPVLNEPGPTGTTYYGSEEHKDSIRDAATVRHAAGLA